MTTTVYKAGRITVSRLNNNYNEEDLAVIEIRLLGIPLPLVRVTMDLETFGRAMLGEGRVPCELEVSDTVYNKGEDSG